MNKPERILVIRLGALGDLVMCCQAFHEIRLAHPLAKIALLTSKPFVAFAQAMPWFDEVIIDDRPQPLQLKKWLALLRRIRAFNPTRVYDLQGKRRQNILFTLLGGSFKLEWSGAAPFCSHPRVWPPEPAMHFTDFIAAQLRRAGVAAAPPVDFSWLDAPINEFNLPEKFAVLVTGSGAKQDIKRWPAQSFAEVANRLRGKGIASIVVGTAADKDAVTTLRQLAPDVINLCGKTSLFQLGALGSKAAVVIGNDSGPLHLMSAVGAPTLILLSGQTSPVWTAPRGDYKAWLQKQKLSDLSVDEVFLMVEGLVTGL